MTVTNISNYWPLAYKLLLSQILIFLSLVFLLESFFVSFCLTPCCELSNTRQCLQVSKIEDYNYWKEVFSMGIMSDKQNIPRNNLNSTKLLNMFEPVGERLLRLYSCDEDIVWDSMNGWWFRRCWRSSDCRRTDAIVPPFLVVTTSSDCSQHEVFTKLKPGVMLSRQEVNVVAATLRVLKITGSGCHGSMKLRRLEPRTPDGRRAGRWWNLDVVEESIEDSRWSMTDVTTELTLDARHYWLHCKPIHVTCDSAHSRIYNIWTVFSLHCTEIRACSHNKQSFLSKNECIVISM